MRKKYLKTKGFTLIEMLVYLALFGILISGAVITAYSIFESGNRNSAQIMVQEEGNFLIAKINWALSSISTISSPTPSSSSSKLSVVMVDSTTIDIEQSSGDITMTRDGTTQTLNNSNVSISDLLFNYGQNGEIEWITSSFTLYTHTADGKTLSREFQSTKYLRK